MMEPASIDTDRIVGKVHASPGWSQRASTNGEGADVILPPPGTRSCLMRLTPQEEPLRCPGCDEFAVATYQKGFSNPIVLCNVYVDGRWDRREDFHPECYTAAGKPHGEPVVVLKRSWPKRKRR